MTIFVDVPEVLVGARERLEAFGWEPRRTYSERRDGGPMTLHDAIVDATCDKTMSGDDERVAGCLRVIARHLDGEDATDQTVNYWLHPFDHPRTVEEVAEMLSDCAHSFTIGA